MKKMFDSTLWRFNESAKPTFFKRVIMGALVIAGYMSIYSFGKWWFQPEHGKNILFFVILSALLWWGIFRMAVIWLSYFFIKKSKGTKPGEGLSVAIFTTSSPGEPLSMFDKTLEACKNINYPHTTYLLDDTQDPAFKAVAEKHGAVWLELVGYKGAKAGKINAALKKTTEDFILILDPDHIPFPNFLDETLGFFKDEKVGYVQVSQAYYNQYVGFVAEGAAEQTYGFYGPTQMGLNGMNSSVAIGANCTFRRKALESIGGHGIGLAEDCVTAIRIHSKGWKSVYHPVVVSRGLVPEDFGSFCRQQLKWARGIHEVLFTELPKAWAGLKFLQRLSYFSIGTYYSSGFVVMLFLFLPYFTIYFPLEPATIDFTSFFIYWLQIVFFAILIFLYAQTYLAHPTSERGIHIKSIILKFACWPVFSLGFILSLFNKRIPYIPTAKQAVGGISAFLYPHLAMALIYFLTFVYLIFQRGMTSKETEITFTTGKDWSMLFFASIAFIMTCLAIYAALVSRNVQATEPWAEISIDEVNQLNKEFVTKN